MKKFYLMPQTIVTGIDTERLIAASVTETQGADGLDVGGSTRENNITSGNVKVNTVDWEDWEDWND